MPIARLAAAIAFADRSVRLAVYTMSSLPGASLASCCALGLLAPLADASGAAPAEPLFSAPERALAPGADATARDGLDVLQALRSRQPPSTTAPASAVPRPNVILVMLLGRAGRAAGSLEPR
jgi:hypothetical protein